MATKKNIAKAGLKTGSKFRVLLYTKYGQVLLSCILGLGLATVFRRACKSGNCIVHRIPSREDIQTKLYKEDGECFRVSLNESKCDDSKQIVNLDA